ncbi:hypothetical protein SAMN04489802_2801 [Pseudomonas chlororaphis]|uniref:hypothetical protein n=1 Tax=Pseudomonas chlororaphis TaxID=587753 RepID=UPI00087BC829|nr:hypothetical protein [Pseudomonas chlororaphis]AZD67612.1 TolA protein [Pseudomonas chlororaphis subsp. aurantiaca]QIT23582.1 hypothetical protein HCN09_18230 [Pseudomonas chlororaphis subsp. aurantiaca]WDH01676.1 hypothetical protein PUP57_19355 [Pseudomonas chlororaphis]WDH09476.1 hypothetical protein PUP64_27655 [Pseudomonas chlororaphis]SDS97287.1 hypothetical protein SAMN04489802_2801 [Pseudomonas chlororaphis]
MSAQQQVIKIDDISEENAPAIYVAGGLGQFFDAVAAEVTAEVPDLTTRKGRERIASLAAKVSKSKTAVEKPGRDYLKRLKEMPKVVEAELREFVNKMDALRDATRQPLTDWEQKELARTDKHIDGIQSIKDMASFDEPPTAAHVAQVIADLELLALDDSWEEFLPEAALAKDQTLIVLRGLHAERARFEAEQAELTRLREEKEARDKKDRDDQIAREAAERATQEAEERAQRARDEESKRFRDEKEAAEKRENDLKLQAAEAERRAEQAKREQVEAEQKAERERLEGIERQAAAVEQARLDEIKRQNEAADEILRQQQAREADKAHKSKVMGAAKEALMSLNITEELAKAIVLKIARGEVPSITIHF